MLRIWLLPFIALTTSVACTQRLDPQYDGRFIYGDSDGPEIQLLGGSRGKCYVSRPKPGDLTSVSATCTVKDKTLTVTLNDRAVPGSVFPELEDGVENLAIDGNALITPTGKRFIKVDPTIGVVSKPNGQSVESSRANPNNLSQSEMLRLMQTKGIWNVYSGVEKYESIEILRVGEFNTENKYWPVRIRAKVRSGGGFSLFVWDVRISKDDYGEWQARRVG